MLTVWSVCVGDKYATHNVLQLYSQVERHLAEPFRFVCITDREIPAMNTIAPYPGLPGWWQKIALFAPGRATGPNLYLDLDVLIYGALDDLVGAYGNCDLAAPRNWAQSGHDSVQSSVMLWRGENPVTLRIFEDFDLANAHWPPINRPGVLWGDQEWITHLHGNPGEGAVTAIKPRWVRSYKYHCQQQVPDDCRVVVFHGEPKPMDVAWQHNWIRDALK